MKKVLAGLGFGVLLACLLLISYFNSSNKISEDFTIDKPRFEKIAWYGGDQYIYVDKQTGIEYFVIKNGQTAWGSVLLDENGEPVKKN